jgi:hydrogenase maturation protease
VSGYDTTRPDVVVLGLGNPLLGDDGVGWRVAERVRAELESLVRPGGEPAAVDVDFVSVGGLGLMERLIGYRRAVLVDAMTTGRFAPGTVQRFPLEALPNTSPGHSASVHDASLGTALAVGRAAGAQLPSEITVVAIEALRTWDFSEQLTAPVAAAVPEAVRTVMEALNS